MKIVSVFVIRKNASSIEERDFSNAILNRLTNRVTKLKQQKTNVQIKIFNQDA